jgi:hypothetical protein
VSLWGAFLRTDGCFSSVETVFPAMGEMVAEMGEGSRKEKEKRLCELRLEEGWTEWATTLEDEQAVVPSGGRRCREDVRMGCRARWSWAGKVMENAVSRRVLEMQRLSSSSTEIG